MEMEVSIQNNTLTLMVGDITNQETDVIVNAANGSLLGGGGVDGAIHRAAGHDLLQACKKVRTDILAGSNLPTGEAVMTKGFQLPASYVIHTVGPIWGETSHADELLANCYKNSLLLANSINDCTNEFISKNGGLLSRDMGEQGDAVKHSERLSISFPSISTGVYKFPIERAAHIALETISDFLQRHSFGDVVMTLFSEDDYNVYKDALQNRCK